MAHVVYSINITVAGSCHHEDAVPDEEHHRYALELLASADSVLLGRNTFDLFAHFWPEALTNDSLPTYMKDFAIELELTPKYVLTNRALATKWKNTIGLQGPELTEVRELITRTAGKLVMFGSPKLGASLINAGLINELHIVVQPLVGPNKVLAFQDLGVSTRISLIEARPFESGALLLRYDTAA